MGWGSPTRLPCNRVGVALTGEASKVGLQLGVVKRALGGDGGVEGETGVRRLGLKGDGKGGNTRDGYNAVVFVEPDVLLGHLEVADCVRGELGLSCLLELGWALAKVDVCFVANGALRGGVGGEGAPAAVIAEQSPGTEHSPLAGVKGGPGELNHEAVVGSTGGILRDHGGKVLAEGRAFMKPSVKARAGGFQGDAGFKVTLEDGGVGCAVDVGRVSQNGKGGWERNFKSSLQRVDVSPHLSLVSSDLVGAGVGSGSTALKLVHALVVVLLHFGNESNGGIHDPF